MSLPRTVYLTRISQEKLLRRQNLACKIPCHALYFFSLSDTLLNSCQVYR